MACNKGLCLGMESKNSRKEGLPKREPPWSTGGQDAMISSMEERIEMIFWIIVGADEEREEIFLPAADSEREKTKDNIRE